jgi:hypothetical protein
MSDANRDRQNRAGDTGEPRPGPEVVPAISAERPSIAGGVGAAYVGRDHDLARQHDLDQESHVSPTDNDGETVPRDEVVDKVGG